MAFGIAVDKQRPLCYNVSIQKLANFFIGSGVGSRIALLENREVR